MPRKVHFIGVCGRMVGGLALVLKKLGVEISGSDETQFPPMPEVLRDGGIQVNANWAAANVPHDVEAVVTGSLIFRWNPELEEAMLRGLPIWNSTAFLEKFFLRDTENFVVAGTKGKTTTTAMLAWILDAAGKSPDYMIGGQIRTGNWARVRLDRSPIMVLEGDEYRCGFGDPLPKFHRYHARHLLVTNVEHDHLEMFPTRLSYRDAFMHLVCCLPKNGTLTLNADDPTALWLAKLTPTPVQTVGFSRKATFRLTGFKDSKKGISFRLGGVDFQLGLSGRTNAIDAALASVMAGHAGVSLREAAWAIRKFPGVEGRMDKKATIGRTVVYADEAYLPIAVGPLLKALRHRHPGRRLVLLFEPRHTGGREGFGQKELPECLANADIVITGPSVEGMAYAKPFDHQLLCRDLRKIGVAAIALKSFENLDVVSDQVRRVSHDGDIIVVSLSINRTGGVNNIVQAFQQGMTN